MKHDFDDHLGEQLKDPDFKREYGSLEPGFAVIQAMIDARRENGSPQKQLSEKTGITQADMSKPERGIGNPSLRTLRRLADGLGLKLKLEFVPADAS